MKMSKTTKALKKQATKAELVAQRSADAFVAEQMSNLAQAFRAQAEVLKRKRKGVTELLHVVADPSDKRLPEVARACLAALGTQLLSLKQQILELRTKNDDQKTGVEIVRKALSYPARQIAINAGEDGSVIVGKILEKDQYAWGFDSQTGEYVNLISKGIIDPTKVVRVAIQNAASVAALLITTEAMVAEQPKTAGPEVMPAGGGARRETRSGDDEPW
jgi:chaperonin GroEL (HSP60 family)